ncbi:MAG: hypothetical protein ACJ8LG_17745 [Massilia sp.]
MARPQVPPHTLLLALLLALPGLAQALEPLPDAALAQVAGRDGMSFNLSGFAMSGSGSLRYYTPDNRASFALSNLWASRSDNLDAPFADPYRLDVTRSAGRADIISVLRPVNAAGREVWQVGFDLDVDADGRSAHVGSVVMKDLVYYGGGMQFSTPQAGDGLAFGYALRSELGSMALQPNGRAASGEALVLSTLRIGAATSDGSAPVAPWRIADVVHQPGIFNARTDADGNARLHIGIDWPDAAGAPSGTLQVANISFRSEGAPPVDLGASRIGAIQLQYLDIRFRP